MSKDGKKRVHSVPLTSTRRVTFDSYVIEQCVIQEDKQAASAQLDRFSKYVVR
jgi:hypothetical protein